MEHRQAREHQQDEADAGDPVIDPGECVVADDRPSGVAHFGSLPDSINSLAWSSSSGCTSLGPVLIQWKNPASAVKATPAMAMGLINPFQNCTKLLICGSLGKPE